MKKIIAFFLALSVILSVSGCAASNRQEAETTEPSPFSQDNPYAVHHDESRSYLLPDSLSSYLCWSDIRSFTKEEAYLAQQEIYARYGQQFDDPYLTEYFSVQSWYSPTTNNASDQLSEQATMNLFLLEVYCAVQDNSIQNWDNPYIPLCAADDMLPESSIRSLTDADLRTLTAKELVIARNEIFARHGYIFSDQDLRAYFYTKPWYRPTTLSRDFNFGCLSALEAANVELIQKYEDDAPTSNGGNNNSAPSGIPSEITVVDKYTYLLNNDCFHIPYVELPTATAINDEMYVDCYGLLERHVFNEPSQPMLYSMLYTVGRKGDVVSVMVYAYQVWDCDMILVYNFSASTGKKLSDSQVFAAYGLTEAEGKAQIHAALEAYWDMGGSGDRPEYIQDCINKTLSDSNLATWHPYIDAAGNLRFAGIIYSPAGAEYYEHLLDQSGNDLPGPGCPIHG